MLDAASNDRAFGFRWVKSNQRTSVMASCAMMTVWNARIPTASEMIPMRAGRPAPPTCPTDETKETAATWMLLGIADARNTMLDGNNGPQKAPMVARSKIDTAVFLTKANTTPVSMVMTRYTVTARLMPTRSVTGPKMSLPTAIPAQKPVEQRLARAGRTLRALVMKRMIQPEMALSVPTYMSRYAAHIHTARCLMTSEMPRPSTLVTSGWEESSS